MAHVIFPHWLEWIWVPLWLGILGSLFAGAIAIRLRLRRSTGIERLQTLWLAWAASLIPLGLVFCAVTHIAFGGPGAVLFAFLLAMEAAVATAIGIAVVRYRLYAIERLINRTLVYGTLTLPARRRLHGRRAGGRRRCSAAARRGSRPPRRSSSRSRSGRCARACSAPSTAASTGGASRPCGSSGSSRRGAGGQAGARGDRSGPRRGARRPARRARSSGCPRATTYANASGELVWRSPADGRARTEITRDGSPAAVLLHDPALADRRLLTEALHAAALSVEIARLRVELRLQLQEVQASRARIVEAGYEERRRLERDLHDGAQQRLVSLGLRLRRMQRTLPREAQVLSPAFDAIVDEVGSAIADLRQIAAGVRPARLDDGLAAALHDLARSSPVDVDVSAPVGRVAASVEAAAYFVVCEALTNAVKHASASRVAIRARRDNGTLRLSVSDDGVGGATVRRGSGLAGLIDRVAAHGGSLEIASPRGGGTRIEVAIPCES